MIFKVSNRSTKYEKITLKFVILSIAFARLGTILPVVREITLMKTYNFRIKSGMYKRCIIMSSKL